MPLADFSAPWQGAGIRHQPQGSLNPVTSTLYAGTREGRWNRKGEKVFYLACDAAIALNEYARWLHTESGAIQPVAREVFRLHIELDAVIDLRRSDVQAALSITSLADFLPWSKCQAYAAMIRTTGAEAMLVPPAGALDKPAAWNLVIFLDAFDNQASFVKQVESINVIQVSLPPS